MSDEVRPIPGTVLDSIQPIVLVGGKSRRFGRDKLVEPWGDKRLVQHPIDVLRQVFGSRVRIVGECDPRIPPLADGVIPDKHPGAGPIGGLCSALDFWGGPVFVLAGDMPQVSPAEILRIIVAAEQSDWAAAVVAFTDRLHSCFGIYQAASRPLFHGCLQAGTLRLADAIPD
jgi:molybdopterin-guanine dinucleotide biosynthesis protein A